jgi:hypothetical protein
MMIIRQIGALGQDERRAEIALRREIGEVDVISAGAWAETSRVTGVVSTTRGKAGRAGFG